MKIQDAAFALAAVFLLLLKRPRLFLFAGLSCFILSIPLFAGWIFFTAERLTWYGAGFILIYLLIQ